MTVQIETILRPELTQIVTDVPSKKKLFEQLSQLVADQAPNYDNDAIYQGLLKRERQGSTGIGHGIAIPHCRLSECDEPFAALLKLSEPLDFDAIDRRPVELVFALFVPEEATNDHLHILSLLAQLLCQDEYRQALKLAPSDTQLFERAIEAPLEKR